MAIRRRLMRASDIAEGVEIVGAQPLVACRYGALLGDLRLVWREMLASRSFAGSTVVEEQSHGRVCMLGIGISVFLSDEFLGELKRPPHFWIGPELVRRMGHGQSPLLTAAQVREANSCGGLNLAIWHGSLRPEAARRPKAHYEVTAAFLDDHRGFLLKEIVAQADSAEHLLGMCHTGTFLWDDNSRGYGDFAGQSLDRIVARPHLAGLDRDRALQQPNSWGGSLFVYEPPQFGFSESEQRLLLASLDQSTDEELSHKLGIPLFTVKKSWRRIYERVAAQTPELIPPSPAPENGASERDREKKHRLIAYLRNHPEELRPFSRTLLKRAVLAPI